MSEFIQHLCLVDMFRTSSVHLQERFFYKLYSQIWYVVIRVLLNDVSSSTRVTTY